MRHLLRPSLSDERKEHLERINEVSFVPMEAVGENGGLTLEIIKEKADVESGYTLFFDGDVIVAKITPCFENCKGAVATGLHNGVAYGTTELHVLTPREDLQQRFLFYVTISHEFRIQGEAEMKGAAGQKRIPEEFIQNFRLRVPPVQDQERIVRYLDRRTAQIDKLISEKEVMLRLLGEKAIARSARKVTHGLDHRVRLRPSYLTWLPEVPIHWTLKRGKLLLREIDERSSNGDETLLSLRMERGLVPHNDVSEKEIPSENLIGYKIARPGEIVLNRMRAASGLVAVAPQHGIVSPDYAVFRALDSVDPEYFTLLFKTPLMQAVFRSLSKGLGTGESGFLRLYSEDFLSIKLPVPPLHEQKAIVAELARERDRTATVETALEESIKLLKERRAALITAAVTGKLSPEEMSA